MGRSFFLLLVFTTASLLTSAQAGDLELRLRTLPGVKTVKVLPDYNHWKEAWELTFEQPVSYDDPEAGTFLQRVFVSHLDFEHPVVVETNGYAIQRNKPMELSLLLEANQVQVEYRYYGKSKPDPLLWEHLKSKHAMQDLHQIVEALKRIYDEPWVSTGISKGGNTALLYKRFYPDDVAACVPYVAPMALGPEDPRTDRWQEETGEAWCRAKIQAFQRQALTMRDELLPMLEDYAERKKVNFPNGADVAFEYMVLEYPFSFWQWGGVSCALIPDLESTPKEVYAHLSKVVSPYYYGTKGIADYEPSFYQHLTELGYYGFPKDHLEDLLAAVPNPSNADFAPANVPLPFDSAFVPEVLTWLAAEGNNIIYVYGELDTWTACAVPPSDQTNAVYCIAKGADHTARIRHLSDAQKKAVYQALEEWVGVEVMKP